MTDHQLNYEAFWQEVQLYREFDYSWTDGSAAHHHPDHDADAGYGGMTNEQRRNTPPSEGETCTVEGYPLSLLERGDALNGWADDDDDNDTWNISLNTNTFVKRTADPTVDVLHGRCYTCCCLFVEGVVLGTAFAASTASELRWNLTRHNLAIALDGERDRVWEPYVDAGLGERVTPIPDTLEPHTYYVCQDTGHNYLIIGYDPESDLVLTLEAAHRPELCDGAGTFGGVGHRGIGRAGERPPTDWVNRLLFDLQGTDAIEKYTWSSRTANMQCLVKLNIEVPVEGLGDLRFPLKLDANSRVSNPANADFLYEDTEKTHTGGYYPVGVNTVWHGGLHLRAWRGAPVYACADGEVIAARLAPKAKAWGAWGSYNFVLTRHRYREFTFYMLYMHLDSSDGENLITSLPWLDPARTAQATSAATVDPVQIEGDVVIGGDPLARLSANFSLWEFEVAPNTYRIHLQLLQHLQQLREDCGCALNVLSTASTGAACTVSSSNSLLQALAEDLAACGDGLSVASTSGGQVTLTLNASAEACAAEAESLIEKLGLGQVVAPNVWIKAGELLGWVGEYGKEDAPEGQLHWEIFSDRNASNLFTGWSTVMDTDDDFNMDNEAIMRLFDDDQQSGIWDDDTLLSEEELISFFQRDDSPAASLRRYATYFVSEWGIDVGPAIEQLLSWEAWYTYDLEGKLSHYLWWDAALDAGVELPTSRHVWHFHPVAFLQDLHALIAAQAD